MTPTVLEKSLDIPDELKRRIEEEKKQLAAGQGIPFEVVMKKTRQPFDDRVIADEDTMPKWAEEYIEKGLREIEEGQVISDEEMRKTLAKWL
jgi:predicted transcriptional regulator